MSQERMGRLRELLHDESEESWAALMRQLEGWPDLDELVEVVIPYCGRHLGGWTATRQHLPSMLAMVEESETPLGSRRLACLPLFDRMSLWMRGPAFRQAREHRAKAAAAGVSFAPRSWWPRLDHLPWGLRHLSIDIKQLNEPLTDWLLTLSMPHLKLLMLECSGWLEEDELPRQALRLANLSAMAGVEILRLKLGALGNAAFLRQANLAGLRELWVGLAGEAPPARAGTLEALVENESLSQAALRKLSFDECYLGPESVRLLADAAKLLEGLDELELRYNPHIDQHGIHKLLSSPHLPNQPREAIEAYYDDIWE